MTEDKDEMGISELVEEQRQKNEERKEKSRPKNRHPVTIPTRYASVTIRPGRDCEFCIRDADGALKHVVGSTDSGDLYGVVPCCGECAEKRLEEAEMEFKDAEFEEF